jgi:hypothetical protein
VFADTTLTGATLPFESWLSSGSHFLVDEVVASANGVQLRTSRWTELDALEAQLDYARETKEEDYDLSD